MTQGAENKRAQPLFKYFEIALESLNQMCDMYYS